MVSIIGYDRPETTALGGFSARVQHRCAGFFHEDTISTAHVLGAGHELETAAPDPVAKSAAVEADPTGTERAGRLDHPPQTPPSRTASPDFRHGSRRSRQGRVLIRDAAALHHSHAGAQAQNRVVIALHQLCRGGVIQCLQIHEWQGQEMIERSAHAEKSMK